MPPSGMWLPTGNLDSWGLTVLKPQPTDNAGAFTGGGNKILWHTTEGGGMSSALGTLAGKGAPVHFVFDPLNGRVTQCIPLDKAGKGLQHTLAPETNRACVIQIEMLAFATEAQALKVGAPVARAVPNFGVDEYQRMAGLACLIEHRFPVPRHAAPFRRPKRMGGQEFVDFAGHCGHVHVPGNSHYDPGTGFNWPLLLEQIKTVDH